MRTQCERNANHKPLTINHNQDKKIDKKGKAPRGTRLNKMWRPSVELIQFQQKERPDLITKNVVASFVDYWTGLAGAKANKIDWDATFRNWVRSQKKEYTPKPEKFNASTYLAEQTTPMRRSDDEAWREAENGFTYDA